MSPPIRPFNGLSPLVADLVIEGGRVVYRDERKRRRKVAICGSTGVLQMPVDDPSVECWYLNNFYNMARDSQGRLAASRWFEQHQITPDDDGPHRGEAIQDANDLAWLRECPVPIYTTEPFPENPNAVVWPVERMAAKYRNYFTCSFAYQIAQAIDEGFEELIVCGLELLLGTKREATVESSCTNWWLGLAEGRGMRVTIRPKRSALAAVTPWLGRSMHVDEIPQFLLRHPYWYGHDYWLEADFVKDFVSRWDERKVAV